MRPAEIEELRHRLLVDAPFYAEHCLKIVDKHARLVPLVARPWQLRFDEAIERQRAAGLPVRIIVLKARKLGFSTWVQARIMQGVTQLPNRKALVVAQDNDTAGELFDIGKTMWRHLPTRDVIGAPIDLKPPIAQEANSKGGKKFLLFGEPSRARRNEGFVGLDSSIEIDTAKEVGGGRGYTPHYLHGSEVAWWPDERKLTSLLNAVPDSPETMVVLESTANGQNHFKRRWVAAEQGRSAYVPVFAAWHEDPDCRLPFASEEERERFVETIGLGDYGEDEPTLIELYGCTPEQLAWRRFTIEDKCESNVDIFKQEYPSSPEEAFIASGATVFAGVLITRAVAKAKQVDQLAEGGVLIPSGTMTRRTAGGKTVEVPTGAIWAPKAATGFSDRDPMWRVWERPSGTPVWEDEPEQEQGELPREGRYVVVVDPAGDEITSSGKTDFFAIQVVNHRTREQAAEWRGRIDPDQVADQAILAALHFNEAVLGVERTGGYGLSIARTLAIDYRYRWMYFRKTLDSRNETTIDRLGWDTTRMSKPLLIDGMRELLREGTHGIRSALLAHELTTYVRDSRGKPTAETDEFDDLLMAYMIAQYIAEEQPPRPDGRRDRASRGWAPRNPVTGY